MSERRTPQSFICEGCNQMIVKRPSPQRDTRTQYCSKYCKLKAWTKRQEKPCRGCGVTLKGGTRKALCAECHSETLIEKRRVRKLAKAIVGQCVICQKQFTTFNVGVKTCSASCRSAMNGRALQPKPLLCKKCGRMYVGKLRTSCPECRRAAIRAYKRTQQRGTGRSHCQRASYFGVPRDYSITNLKVFIRDGWRCQLCGCSTPKHLKGKNRPTSPELDHILPLSKGGGHTWDNVQCVCRACNIRKGSKPLGQMRLIA